LGATMHFNTMLDDGIIFTPTIEAFIAFAREENARCAVPMGDDRVVRTATSRVQISAERNASEYTSARWQTRGCRCTFTLSGFNLRHFKCKRARFPLLATQVPAHHAIAIRF